MAPSVATPEERPRTRADCAGGPRPCPWVGCRHNLYLSVDGKTVVLTVPAKEPWEMGETCALDVAARGGQTREELAEMLNVSDEWVRQIELKALAHMARVDARLAGVLAEHAADV